jgi:hypothetical protein
MRLTKVVTAVAGICAMIALAYFVLGEKRGYERYKNTEMCFSIAVLVGMEQLSIEQPNPVGDKFGPSRLLFDAEREVGFSRQLGDLKRDFQSVFISTARLPENPPPHLAQAILLESLIFIKNSPVAARMLQYEELEPLTAFKVNGMQAARIRYSMHRGDKLYRIEAAVMSAEKAYYIIWYSGFEHKEATDRLCSDMLQSMKFM